MTAHVALLAGRLAAAVVVLGIREWLAAVSGADELAAAAFDTRVTGRHPAPAA